MTTTAASPKFSRGKEEGNNPRFAVHDFHGYVLKDQDREILMKLTVPVPYDEAKRIEILRESKLLDGPTTDTAFDRLTTLTARLLKMPMAVISFVDIDRVWNKSKKGVEITELSRNNSFAAYNVLPTTHDVFVVEDALTDPIFMNNPYVKAAPHARFYAGTPICVENVKIGVLCVFDTVPHSDFDLKARMNLLDLGNAVSHLAKERRRIAMNLNSERANLVVNMMHNLRTPMTSLSFASSLISEDMSRLDPKNTTSKKRGSIAPDENAQQLLPIQNTFNDIENSLNQLNELVQSSLSLGQAILDCNNSESKVSNHLRGVECSLSETLEKIHNTLNDQLSTATDNFFIEWIVHDSLVCKKAVSFPDALRLILISAIGQVRVDWKKIGVECDFKPLTAEEIEYPELADKIIEGLCTITIYRLDKENEVTEALTTEKFLSIGNILSAVNGGSKTLNRKLQCRNAKTGEETLIDMKVNEFWVPCKILWDIEDEGDRSFVYTNTDVVRKVLPSTKAGETELETRLLPEQQKSVQPVTDDDDGDEENDFDVVTPTIIRPMQQQVWNKSVIQRNPTSSTKSLSGISGPTIHVLVMEDTISVQKLLSRWLQKEGAKVTCVSNGRAGVDLLCKQYFDLTLVDFLMPIQLGTSAIKDFQAFKSSASSAEGKEDEVGMTIDSDAKPSFNKEVLIVGMSATALKSEQDEGFKNGMHFFCPKPVGLHLLSTILDNCRTHTSLNDRINGICDDTDAHKIPQVEQQANDKSPESFRSIKQFLQSNGSE